MLKRQTRVGSAQNGQYYTIVRLADLAQQHDLYLQYALYFFCISLFLLMLFTYSFFRQLSFIITHCPVVWTSEDRYNFIEKLEKYRDFNRSLYDLLTSDLFARAILTVDFWTRLDTAAPSTSAFMLQPLYTQGKNTSYTNMEGIRSFHKYAYAHNPVSTMCYVIIL